MAHNPEVAGSNPAPATNFRRSRPFPGRERAFAFSDAVAKHVAATWVRAAWRRDGGDGAARDETAWTWWTLPPAVAGCFAQRYRKCIPASSHSCWTSRNTRSRSGVTSARRMYGHGIRPPGTRGPVLALPLLELISSVADRAVPMRLRIRPAHCAVWSAWACSLSHRRRALGTHVVAAGSKVAGS